MADRINGEVVDVVRVRCNVARKIGTMMGFVISGGIFAVLAVIVGFIWAWALGGSLWHWVVPSAIVGLLLGMLSAAMLSDMEEGGLETLGLFIFPIMILGLLFVLAVVGILMRIFRWIFF